MPTLPLYTPADTPDASHRVLAPGGYETWRFDAEAAGGDVRIAAVLGLGWPLDANYLRRYLRYRRRPTRRPPPVPAEHPFAHVWAYEGGRLLAEFRTYADPAEYAASPHEPAVKVAGNEFVRERDGSLSLRLRGVVSRSQAAGGGGGSLSAQLVFRPLLPHPPLETSWLAPHGSPVLHGWVIAAPLCQVSGTVALTPAGGDGSRGAAREIDLRGRGYHDHSYGTAPPAAALRRWARGHAFLGDATYAFHLARPIDRARGDEVHLARCDAGGVRTIDASPSRIVWSTGRGLQRYLEQFDCDARLRLARPRVIDASGGRVRLLYDASDDRGETGTAYVEVDAPERRVPAFGRQAAAH
jgi:hypothetical protein